MTCGQNVEILSVKSDVRNVTTGCFKKFTDNLCIHSVRSVISYSWDQGYAVQTRCEISLCPIMLPPLSEAPSRFMCIICLV